MAGFDVPWTEILIFNLPHEFFCSILDNVEIIVNKICLLKEYGGVTERLKIVKSRQRHTNGHLPFHCSFYSVLSTRIDAGHDVGICMGDKDAQN